MTNEAATAAEITTYDQVDAELSKLRDDLSTKVYDVTTPKGLADAKSDRMLVRTMRTDVEKVRKILKQPHIDAGKEIDDRAKELTAALREIEEPIDELIKSEERRKAAEKAELERLEQERVSDIKGRIERLRGFPSSVMTGTAEEARSALRTLQEIEIDETFMEFAAEAAGAKSGSVGQLEMMVAQKEQAEADAAERERLQAENDRMKAEQAQDAPELPALADGDERPELPPAGDADLVVGESVAPNPAHEFPCPHCTASLEAVGHLFSAACNLLSAIDNDGDASRALDDLREAVAEVETM